MAIGDTSIGMRCYQHMVKAPFLSIIPTTSFPSSRKDGNTFGITIGKSWKRCVSYYRLKITD
jgi:hypothetical protein